MSHSSSEGSTSLYRIYKNTLQRVTLDIQSLNSHCAFLLILELERHVLAWIGSDCESADQEMVKELGLEVLTKDMKVQNNPEIGIIYEGSEPNKLLELFLELIESNETTYYKKNIQAKRKERIMNSHVTSGIIEPCTFSSDENEYEFQETSFIQPDNRGTVPRINFAPIEYDTIAYVNIGDQWDIWITRGCSKEKQRNIMIFIKSYLNNLLLEKYTNFKSIDVMKKHVKIIKQGMEHTLFRQPLKIFTDFEPPGLTAPREESNINDDNDSIGAAESKGSDNDDNIKKKSLRLNDDDNENNDDDNNNDTVGVVNFWKPNSKQNDLDLGDLVYNIESDKNQQHDRIIGEDINNITEGMLKVIETENENPERRKATIEDAMNNPASLIGYQIEIDEGIYAGIFIVTKIRKTSILKKTLFYLQALDGDEFWIRLKRGKKSGYPFRPLRRVVPERCIDYSLQIESGNKKKSKKKKDDGHDVNNDPPESPQKDNFALNSLAAPSDDNFEQHDPGYRNSGDVVATENYEELLVDDVEVEMEDDRNVDKNEDAIASYADDAYPTEESYEEKNYVIEEKEEEEEVRESEETMPEETVNAVDSDANAAEEEEEEADVPEMNALDEEESSEGEDFEPTPAQEDDDVELNATEEHEDSEGEEESSSEDET